MEYLPYNQQLNRSGLFSLKRGLLIAERGNKTKASKMNGLEKLHRECNSYIRNILPNIRIKGQKTLAEGRFKIKKRGWLFMQIIIKLNLPQDVVDPNVYMGPRADCANS